MLQLLYTYVVTVVFGCFKSRSGITHGMRVGSGRLCGRCLGRHGTTTGALPHEPDALGTRSLLVRVAFNASARTKRPDASKFVSRIAPPPPMAHICMSTSCDESFPLPTLMPHEISLIYQYELKAPPDFLKQKFTFTSIN